MLTWVLGHQRPIFWTGIFLVLCCGITGSFIQALPPTPRAKLKGTGPLAPIGFSPDGKTFACLDRLAGTWNGHSHQSPLRTWEVSTGNQLAQISLEARDGKPLEIESAKYSPNGDYMMLCCRDGPVRIVNLVQSRETGFIDAPDFFNHEVRFSQDGKRVFAVTPQEVLAFDLEEPIRCTLKGERLQRFGACSPWIEKGFTPTVVPESDRQKFWWSATTEMVMTFEPEFDSHRGEALRFRLFDLSGAPRLVTSFKRSKVVASADGQTLTWTVDGKKNQQKFSGGLDVWPAWRISVELPQPFNDGRVQWNKNRTRVAACAWRESSIQELTYWNVEGETPKEMQRVRMTHGVTSPDLSMLCSVAPTSRSLHATHSLAIHDLERNERRVLGEVPSPNECALSLSFDSQFASYSDYRWEKVTTKLEQMWNHWAMKFSSFVGLKLTPYIPRVIPRMQVWDLKAGEVCLEVEDQYAFAFSPTERILASQSSDYEVSLWEIPAPGTWPIACILSILPALLLTSVAFRLTRYCLAVFKPA